MKEGLEGFHTACKPLGNREAGASLLCYLVVSYDGCCWIFVFEVLHKFSEGVPLGRGVIALGIAFFIYTAYKTDSDAFSVVSAGMCSCLFEGSSCFYCSVSSDYVVVSDCEESSGFVPACYFCRSYVHAWLGGGAVDYDFIYVSYVSVPPVLRLFFSGLVVR